MRRRLLWMLAILLAATTLPLRDRLGLSRPPHQALRLQAGDVDVRAVRAGTGSPTLLLLHGYGESLMTWRGLLEPLAVLGSVVAVDLPGFGASAKPDGPYTLEAQVQRLEALLDGSTTGPVILIGHSMGGEIAAALALARPDRVSKLVLIAPAGIEIGLGGLVDTMTSTKARLIGWYQAIRSFVLPIHDPRWLAEAPPWNGYDLTADPAYRHSTAAVLETFDFRALRERLDSIIQPTLLVWGRQDPVIPLAAGETMQANMPCATLFVVDDAFHRPHVEHPGIVLDRIRQFVSAVTPCRKS